MKTVCRSNKIIRRIGRLNVPSSISVEETNDEVHCGDSYCLETGCGCKNITDVRASVGVVENAGICGNVIAVELISKFNR